MPKLQRITPILRKALRGGKGPLAMATVTAAVALASSYGEPAGTSTPSRATAGRAAPVVIAQADTPAVSTPATPATRALRSPFSAVSTRQASPAVEELAPATAPATVADPGSTASSKVVSTAQYPSAAPARMELPVVYATHVAEPSDIDADGSHSSASQPPATAKAPTASLQPRRPPAGGALPSGASDDTGLADVTAAASTATVTVYTPAQIRQAYGFAALPATTTANKGVYQGAGQTIVIIDAYHNATTGSDLNAFSTKFGLPSCKLLASTYKNGASPASIVTTASASDGCVFQTVYVNSAGNATTTAPALNSGWATEIALDVQWAHAIAPLARIVLVEAASSSGNDILKAMQFASQLNANVISMSYGTSETSQTPSLDSTITGNATWVASSGDSGAGVMWPAVSRNVLAVGGTLLTNVSPRAESAWSGSSGGLSKYVRMPAWQGAVAVPGNPANTAANASRMYRGVPDVAYDASPYSGVYVVQNGNWFSIGGTSAGAPQWAALVAVLNGARAYAGKAAYTGTAAQQALYGVAASAANYRATFLDINAGGNGTCATCFASSGYDLVTGLGTPNVNSLVNVLSNVR